NRERARPAPGRRGGRGLAAHGWRTRPVHAPVEFGGVGRRRVRRDWGRVGARALFGRAVPRALRLAAVDAATALPRPKPVSRRGGLRVAASPAARRARAPHLLRSRLVPRRGGRASGSNESTRRGGLKCATAKAS